MNVLLFGMTREIVGADRLSISPEIPVKNVAALRAWLSARYPQFSALSSLAIAVNNEYAEDDLLLDHTSEIALIPPVSGG